MHNPLPLPGESSYLYLTCAQGQRYRLPAALHGWATQTLAEPQQRVAADEVAVLPMTGALAGGPAQPACPMPMSRRARWR